MKLLVTVTGLLSILIPATTAQGTAISKADAAAAADTFRDMAKDLDNQMKSETDEDKHREMAADSAFLRQSAYKIRETEFMPDSMAEVLANAADKGLNCVDNRCKVPISLSGIWHYGCWCNFGKDLLDGQGMPVNKHDQICQDLQFCLRCAKMDAEDDGTYTCDPKKDRFNAGFRWGKKKLSTDCKKRNGGEPCATHLCMCEMTLIGELIALIWEGYTYDPQYRHKKLGGNFKPSKYCLITKTTGPSAKECCGAYPKRAPYSVGGNTDCCDSNNGALYNTISEHCCASGVKSTGDLC